VTPEELARLRRARDLVDRDYAQPLDVPALARAALMSPAHFSRRFRAAFGDTPYGYLMTRRVERAQALLRRGDLSVTAVCVAVGCSSLGSFSTRFRALVGESPSAYRARDHSRLAAVPACVARRLTRPDRARMEKPGAAPGAIRVCFVAAGRAAADPGTAWNHPGHGRIQHRYATAPGAAPAGAWASPRSGPRYETDPRRCPACG
jgi:AraC-like DNA-binding protein